MPRYTLDYIKKLDYKELEQMSMEKLVEINRQAALYAKNRASRAISTLTKLNKEIGGSGYEVFAPQAYREDSIAKYLQINLSPLQKRGQIIHNIRLSQEFLELKTSTVTGYKKVLKNFTDLISEKTGVKIKGQQQKYFYEVFNRLEDYKNLFSNNYQVEKEIAEAIRGGAYENYTPEELAIELENKINEMLINNVEGEEVSEDEQYILGTVRDKNY